MKVNIFRIFILAVIVVLLSGNHRIVPAGNQRKRVRFQITSVAESAAGRTVLAQTRIEGLPGTDFIINLQTGNFKMQACFVSDLLADNQLKIRARLNTRRFYGYSLANLPLYEEDEQNRTVEVGSGSRVILLPFGRDDEAETLKIETTPTVRFVPLSDQDAGRLTIDFDEQLPSGEMTVEAVNTPHKFTVEAILSADGKTIARSAPVACPLEEETEIALPMTSEAVAKDLGSLWKAKLIVNKFIRSRPTDLVGINFDFYRAGETTDDGAKNGNQMIINGGAGIGLLGGEMSYPLKSTMLPDDANYELKFIVRPAPDNLDK